MYDYTKFPITKVSGVKMPLRFRHQILSQAIATRLFKIRTVEGDTRPILNRRNRFTCRCQVNSILCCTAPVANAVATFIGRAREAIRLRIVE